MMLKIVALALVLSVVSGAAGGGFIDSHLDDEDVDDVDDGSVEEQATKLVSLLQVENGDRQAALRGGLNLRLGGESKKNQKGRGESKGTVDIPVHSASPQKVYDAALKALNTLLPNGQASAILTINPRPSNSTATIN